MTPHEGQPTDPEATELWPGLAAREPAAQERLRQLVQERCVPELRARGVMASELPDLANEAYLSVLNYVTRVAEPPRNLAAFLRWRARGVLTRYVRHLQRDRRRFSDVELGHIESKRPGPLTALRMAELRSRILDCANKLKGAIRETWRARYLDELDNEEVGKQLGITRSAVAVRVHRANKTMRNCLDAAGVSR